MTLAEFSYVIGGLFPTLSDGSPDVILADGLVYDPVTDRIVSSPVDPSLLRLNANLQISANPISILGADRYLRGFYLPQLFATSASTPSSVFNQLFTTYVNGWTVQPRNRTMEGLKFIGYVGPGKEFGNSNDSFWSSNGTTADRFYAEISNRDNYDPQALWASWNGDVAIDSSYDIEALRKNLEALSSPDSGEIPPLWYPTFLYTYSQLDSQGNSLGTSYPGPTLFAQPGNSLDLHFKNRITIPGLTEAELQQATLVRNSSYGNSGSDGLSGSTSTNYHLHGSHTNPGGFGDNVVSRYTTGQDWTTMIDLPVDHAVGSYWYHPHYHPAVNQQVYGGLSGFLQLGDPLSKVPAFKDIPRNLAVLKNIDLTVDPDSGDLRITSIDAVGAGVASNQMTMVTVNGQFQPMVDGGSGGWQAITLSNQTNQAFYNISLVHTDEDGRTTKLPIYLYGEDGHQYPQILAAVGTLGTSGNGASASYAQQANAISLSPGKRIDALVYLPQGSTQIASTYSFEQKAQDDALKTYKNANMGGYPDLIASNTLAIKGLTAGKPTGAGPLAVFQVDEPVEPLTPEQQNAVIDNANAGISVQVITPETKPEDYDPNSVPTVNLFELDSQDQPVWKPVRNRQFNLAKGALIGPPEEWDGPTQALLKQYSEETGDAYQRYTALPVGQPGVDTWLGYGNPFLINDHVFPNGNLTIAQLGTMEEWTLRNWSVNNPEKYIGHPFHVHINDYQVLDSDTELTDKNSLEDVTMLNSSGFKYYKPGQGGKPGSIVSVEPLRGSFHEIPEALDPSTVGTLATWGANDQTIRMLFQDYQGTYVFHCHILPHEDAGMMQAIMVIENTDSSWLLPADHLNATGVPGSDDSVRWSAVARLAKDFSPRLLQWEAAPDARPERTTVGDLSGDFIQEITVASNGPGQVRVFDGDALLNQDASVTLSSFDPYPITGVAPWVFAEDFTGDQHRDLLTGGFLQAQGEHVSLHEFQLAGWTTPDAARSWSNVFRFKPWDLLHHHGSDLDPRPGLTADQVGMAVGDFNLDNFSDIALVYALVNGVRITVLDGAALSLALQTGTFEGGYFPEQALLADAVISDPSLAIADDLSLSSGFNLYGQIALENLLLTAQNQGGSATTLTLQLEAGHFIATSEPLPAEDASDGDHSHGGVQTSGSTHHGGEGLHRAPAGADERVINLQPGKLFPLHVVDVNQTTLDPAGQPVSLTPVFAGAQANAGLLVSGSTAGDAFVFAQGNGVNGTQPSSPFLVESADQLPFILAGLGVVDENDITGLREANPDGLKARFNLVNTAYWAYFGRTPDPGGSAFWANKTILGDDYAADQFALEFIGSVSGKQEALEHFGGSLDRLSVASIVTTTAATLWDRDASGAEISRWQRAVDDGLDPSLLPLRMLQSTAGQDLNRVAYLSAASEWTNAQWAITPNLMGNVGLGLGSDLERFDPLSASVASAPAFGSFAQAQAFFTGASLQWLQLLTGSEVSNRGFF